MQFSIALLSFVVNWILRITATIYNHNNWISNQMLEAESEKALSNKQIMINNEKLNYKFEYQVYSIKFVFIYFHH